jgi:signal transduction histidine kinase
VFSGLRIRLTLLYAVAALALLALLGGGGYFVLVRYFERITDLALAHKMAHEFHLLDAPLPTALASADRDWSIVRAQAAPLRVGDDTQTISSSQALRIAQNAYPGGAVTRIRLRDEDDRPLYEVRFADDAELLIDAHSGRVLQTERPDDDDDDRPTAADTAAGNPLTDLGAAAYDAELAAIFVLPLDRNGNVLFDPNPAAAPLAPDAAALSAALATGSDLRTIRSASGEQVRLLTYQLTRSDGPAALQLGRVLTDQAYVLRQLVIGLSVLGGLSIVAIGVSSWWIAGRALRPAQQAWERQQQFIASASHELRTPLTLMRASSEVALRSLPPDDADRRELLTDVISEADHMRRLVDDLLTLSRLDAGKLSLDRRPVILADLLGDIQRQVGRLAAERGITLQLSHAEGVAQADPERLRQVLLIVLDNALRYTPAGGTITVEAQAAGRRALIRVSDTGCGIAPEHLAHIFERFYRADPARGSGTGNTGLGLAIAQALIHAHGGQIRVDSAPEHGTTVTLDLPLSADGR